MPPKEYAKYGVLIFLLAALVYSGTLDHPFVFDDKDNITHNNTVTDFDAVTFVLDSRYMHRPVSFLSFVWNYKIGKLDTTGYHIVNICIHAGCGVLFFILCFMILNMPAFENFKETSVKRETIAFYSALLWVVMPIHVQSVTYVVQRMNSMATFFYLMSLCFYAAARRAAFAEKKRALYTGVIVSGVLAMGSKEIAVTLPVFILLMEWMFIQDLSFSWKNNRHLLLAAAAAIVFSALFFARFDISGMIAASYERRDFTMGERLLTQPRVVLFYLSLIFFPHPERLNLEHDISLSSGLLDPWTTLLSLAALLMMLFAGFFVMGKQRVLAFAIFWFLWNLILESSVIGLEMVFEHRTYLPSLFIIFTLVYYGFRLIDPRIFRVSLLFACCLFTFWTVERNRVWRDERVLLEDSVRKSPEKFRPHYNLGVVYSERKLGKLALKAFERALVIKPDSPQAHANISLEYMNMGRFNDAEIHLREALKLDPELMEARCGLADLYVRTGRAHEGEKLYLKALSLKKEDSLVLGSYADFLLGQGRFREAEKYYIQVLKISPSPGAFNNLGAALLKQGRMREAAEVLLSALVKHPDDTDLRHNVTVMIKEMIGILKARVRDNGNTPETSKENESMLRTIRILSGISGRLES